MNSLVDKMKILDMRTLDKMIITENKTKTQIDNMKILSQMK